MTRASFSIAILTSMIATTVSAQALRPGSIRSETKTVEVPGSGPTTYTLGFLAVPENRSDPASRVIEVAFLRLPASQGTTVAPIVYLAGGPGDAPITEDPRALAEWNAGRRVADVILVDQRGTGRSRPNLLYRWEGPPPLNLFRSEADGRTFVRQVGEAAAAHFGSQGVDLRGYTTAESADDIDALRRALGLETINLLGFSYGTHLALATIRRHGDRIANAVLIGTEGPDHTLKLPWTMDTQWRKIALMAAADPELSRVVPDFDALLKRVLARLDANPMVVSVRSAPSGATVQLPIGSAGLAFILRRDIGDASDLPVFPRLIYSIDQGDPSLLTWFVQRRYQLGAHAMSSVMDAASGASPSRVAQIEAESPTSRFGSVGNFPWPDDARSYGAPDLGAEFRSPLVSNVRTLFLSGTLDYNTPPFQAEEVRWGFPNSWHVIVRNAGHEQILPNPAVGPIVGRFFRGDDVGNATAAWPPLRFVPLTGYDPERTHPSVPRP